MEKRNKVTAALLAFFLGFVGIHRFYLGRTGSGIVYAVFFWTTIPAIIAFIEFLVLITMDEFTFDRKYNKDWLIHQGYNLNTYGRGQQMVHPRHQPRPAINDDFVAPRKPRPKAQRPPARRRPNPYNAAGKQKFQEYDFKGAIQDFKKALDIEPRNIATHFNLACCYSSTEDEERAFYHLDKAAEYGFRNYSKIEEHDNLAYLRSQDAYIPFKKNNYRIPDAPPAAAEPQQLAAPEPESDLLDNLNEQRAQTNVPPADLLDQLDRLGRLREMGVLDEEEFLEQKQRLLGR